MVETHLTKSFQLGDEDWAPYLAYKGLGTDFNEEELEEFIDNIQKPHAICGMCPANPQLKKQPNALVKHRLEKI